MERFTISLDEDLAHEFDHLIAERGYSNRSEAVRDILRVHLARLRESHDGDGPCVANLSYVYNHHERELSERLASHQHDHHELTIASTHAHLDHDHCIETVLLKGPASAVRHFADSLMAERGVHHGQLNLVMADAPAPDGKPADRARQRGKMAARPSAHRH
ncbi:nickel-responsive transcriptional regulator NikR [Acidovorax sp. DW039]|uniref:nickel-responsive transcriptional regulator NikR n=1 Tax=Acidovorax sp. DW039 TaxID=3095606 RepID=UPI0030850602|nr:nickel-responsive transcriptional regulator NikR [Acidovorax sp. DW039]